MAEDFSGGAFFQLLNSLTPGASVDSLFINGIEEQVGTFAAFNTSTGLASFAQNTGDILVVDYRRIDAIQF